MSFLRTLLVIAAVLIHLPVRANTDWNEIESTEELFEGVRVRINAPDDDSFDRTKPTRVIFYALPNGNTIEQTAGKRRNAGVHWRFDIQHIAAQTRMLRAADSDRNYVLVYMEAEGRSWPTWRRKREDSDKRIAEMVDELAARVVPDNAPYDIVITGHSGGGSFDFGFLNAHDEIPAEVSRIAFLDSNYGFDADLGHGKKLVDWLRANETRQLVVIAYDDRNVEFDGKKIVSDTGGTYRATHRMIDAISPEIPLTETTWKDYERFTGDGIEILIHKNPELKILHTALVGDKSGYLHALTIGTPLEGKVAEFDGPRAYDKWISDDSPTTATETVEIPARPADAIGGSAFIDKLSGMEREERETAILAELMKGNIPEFLRHPVPVSVEVTGLEGTAHKATYYVMPDYLAIGSDEDWVRMPMNPHTAQAFCDAFGYFLPTRKMVDDIWKAAEEKLEPQPMTEDREAPATFLENHRLIESQREAPKNGTLIAGIKKDVVLSNRIYERPDRVAIYGWHYKNGTPIQPLTIVHVDWYVDYSHGIRPVKAMIDVDGRPLRYDEILADPHLNGLLSDEGEILKPRYE